MGNKPSILTHALEAQSTSLASRNLQRRKFGGSVRVDYPPKPEYRCPNRLRAGDQIVRPTSSGDGESFSRHHGIYLGSEQVCTRRDPTTPPEVIPMSEFLDGDTYVDVILYDNDSDQARRDTATTARMAAQMEYWVKGSSACQRLLGLSSEDYANFCRTGKSFGSAAGRATTRAVQGVFSGMATSASQSSEFYG